MRTNRGRDLSVPPNPWARDLPPAQPTVTLTAQESATVAALIDTVLGISDVMGDAGYMLGGLRDADELRRLRDRMRS